MAINRYPSKTFYDNKRAEETGRGTLTEVFSEVLGQICLAWAYKHNKILKWDDILVASGGDPYLTMPPANSPRRSRGGRVTPKSNWHNSIKDFIVLPPGRSFGPKGQSQFSLSLLNFAMDPAVSNKTWLQAQAENMYKIKRLFLKKSGYKIYNDKLFGPSSPHAANPYKAFAAAGTGVNADKWNPADIWVINGVGIRELSILNRSRNLTLPTVNNKLVDQFEKRNIIPLSLKKPQSSFHYDVVNTNHYVQRIVLGKTANSTIEFTDGNRDMKINFTVQTVKLPKGLTTHDARRNPSRIPQSARVKSEKHIRLKYTTDGNQLELEYTQTKGGRYALAQMGKIGGGPSKQIINQTTRTGVSKLQNLQMRYTGKTYQPLDRNGNADVDSNGQPIKKKFDLKPSDWYNLKQLGGGKPRRNDNLTTPSQELHDLFADYVTDLWNFINNNGNNNGSVPDLKGRFGMPSTKQQSLVNAEGFWSKSRAGELGASIAGINVDVAQLRTIQNLYEAAASIAFKAGLTPAEQQAVKNAGFVDHSRFFGKNVGRTPFEAGPYVKVY